jgi:4-aminobutyrate aminotransferase-like enzyme/Ser/Thr protein kinase RdoA (MazF antagonist)
MSLAVDRPRFSEEDASKFAQKFYGLKAIARPLPSERDQNFHLSSHEEREFVLKLSSAAETKDILDFQNQAMARLAQMVAQNSSLWVPQVCETVAGEEIATVAGANGSTHFVRMLTYLPGKPLARVKPHSPALLHELGCFLGHMDKALAGFNHPAMRRELKWDMQKAGSTIRGYLNHITEPRRRAIVEQFLEYFETTVAPALPTLRAGVIHNDGNDYNIIVAYDRPTPSRLAQKAAMGIIDFGDMLYSHPVCEVAIASAYIMLNKADPLEAAGHVVGGYHDVLPLTDQELELLYPLMCIRLCASVAMSAFQQKLEPANDYLKISEKPAWDVLERLIDIPINLAHYRLRHACRLAPNPATVVVTNWLKANQAKIGPVIEADLKTAKTVTFDLSVGSPELASLADQRDAQALTGLLFGRMKAAQVDVGIGRYNEARQIYTSPLFRSEGETGPEWRTIHLGIDLFVAAGTPIFAPLDGKIHSFRHNTAQLDYGPTIIIEHEVAAEKISFFTLYGHLSQDSLEGLREGQPVKKGEQIARVGNFPGNGGWPPHLHFQVISDMLGRSGEFPGVALPSQRELWLSICPDPNLILGIPAACLPDEGLSRQEILEIRAQHIGRSLSISYQKPLKIARGGMQYLYDEVGRAYLDAVNNVPHVGHCHPRVVEAGQRQMAVLNTNTRYLHDNLVRYARRLCATLPEPLSVCFFVCTGSEANDLALRLAAAHTGQKDVVIVDGAYHGNLTSLIEISPYKFDGPGGSGAPPHVHKVLMPDGYRGIYKADDPQAGEKYARHVQNVIERLQHQGKSVAAFFCESLLSCGGQIVLPDNYLKSAYHHVRQAGGVCVADEVQVGFGRVGSHFWGFETQGVVPDILTLGKPIGNGHPLAAVVTRPEIAESFNNGMEYFNTYGGNPVSCAIGLAVLDVIEDEKLQANALKVGNRLKAGLERLKLSYPLIGDVRGLGLFIGIELVLDRKTLAPAATQASYIVERMKDHGILMSTDGPLHNVLKIKPPLVFSQENADYLVSTLDKVLAEDVLQLG